MRISDWSSDVCSSDLAGDAHLEGFGSRAGVAKAKGELFAALGADGVAVINADDEYFSLWKDLAGDASVLSFGLRDGVDVQALHLEPQPGTGSRFTLVTPQGRAELDRKSTRLNSSH